MKFPVKVYAKHNDRGPNTRISLRPKLLDALGLRRGEWLEAVVERGVVILCRAEWTEVFECLLRDFPATFVSDRKRALSAQTVGIGKQAGKSVKEDRRYERESD